MLPSGVSIGRQEIVCHFDELEDPRSTINRLHPLSVPLGAKNARQHPKGVARTRHTFCVRSNNAVSLVATLCPLVATLEEIGSVIKSIAAEAATFRRPAME